MTVAQAVVTYLSKQYSVADGERRKIGPFDVEYQA